MHLTNSLREVENSTENKMACIDFWYPSLYFIYAGYVIFRKKYSMDPEQPTRKESIPNPKRVSFSNLKSLNNVNNGLEVVIEEATPTENVYVSFNELPNKNV